MRLTDEGYIDDEEVLAPTSSALSVAQLPLQEREGEYLNAASASVIVVILTTYVLFLRAGHQAAHKHA